MNKCQESGQVTCKLYKLRERARERSRERERERERESEKEREKETLCEESCKLSELCSCFTHCLEPPLID